MKYQVCPNCEGEGYNYRLSGDGDDYFEDREWLEFACSTCNGNMVVKPEDLESSREADRIMKSEAPHMFK